MFNMIKKIIEAIRRFFMTVFLKKSDEWVEAENVWTKIDGEWEKLEPGPGPGPEPIEDWGSITYWDGNSVNEYKTIQMSSQEDWDSLTFSSTARETVEIQGVVLANDGENAIRSVSIGKKVKTIKNNFLRGCTKIGDTAIDFSGVDTVGNYVLYGARAATSSKTIIGPLLLPKESIGTNFCGASFMNFTIIDNFGAPAGGNFLYSVNYFTGKVNCTDGTYEVFNAQSSLFKKNVLATSSSTTPVYTTGVTLVGPRASDVKTLLPNSTSSPYRKLILG